MKKIAILITFLFPQILTAQIADTLDLGEVVITASKIPVLEKETTKPVTIIDEKMIRRNAGKSLAELLTAQNGLMINGANSNPGKDKSVYLRGAGTEYTLILVNGFPVSDPSNVGGAFDLRMIPLSNVERIEIVKGSMSTLYGSDAIAGVINIITREPAENDIKTNILVSRGSFNTTDVMAGVSGSTGLVDYNLNISRQQSDGISEAAEPEGAEFQPDGFERNALNVELDISPTEALRISPFIMLSNFDGEYDNGAFEDADNTFESTLINSGSRFQYSKGIVDLKGAYTFTSTERKNIDSFATYAPKGIVHNADVFAAIKSSAILRYLVGINYQDLNFELQSDDLNVGSSIFSPYATAYLNTDFGLHAEAGLRFNQHSEFGSNWTYNLAPSYAFTDQFRLLLSWSTGFKSPTLNELFGPFGANVNLEPQTSRSINAGLEFNSGSTGLNASVNYFRRKINNLIQFGSQSQYVNVNEQNDSGIELASSYAFGNSEVSAYYNYLTGGITIAGEEQDNLIRRPKHNFGFNWNQEFTPHFLAAISGEFTGKRNDLYFNPDTFLNESVEMDSYFLLNLHLQYSFNNSLTFFGNAKNLLNADYAEVYGFSTAGINFNAGLRYIF